MSEVVNVVVAFAVIVFIVRWATRNSGSSDEAIRARNILGFRPKTVTDQMILTVQTMFPDIPRANIHYDLLRTGSVELTSNKLLERGFLETPPRNYFDLFPSQPTTPQTHAQSTGSASSNAATESSSKIVAGSQTTLISRFHLENRVKDDSVELSTINPGGSSTWEDTPERREKNLRERKAQMILAARKSEIVRTGAPALAKSYFMSVISMHTI